jgi:hypothetical protein
MQPVVIDGAKEACALRRFHRVLGVRLALHWLYANADKELH